MSSAFADGYELNHANVQTSAAHDTTLEQQRAATPTVCATAERLHPDDAPSAAYDVLEALGLAPYREAQR